MKPKFTMQFYTDNAAFSYGEHAIEVARILRRAACQAENGKDYGTIIDINGNSIGEWSVEYAEETIEP